MTVATFSYKQHKQPEEDGEISPRKQSALSSLSPPSARREDEHMNSSFSQNPRGGECGESDSRQSKSHFPRKRSLSSQHDEQQRLECSHQRWKHGQHQQRDRTNNNSLNDYRSSDRDYQRSHNDTKSVNKNNDDRHRRQQGSQQMAHSNLNPQYTPGNNNVNLDANNHNNERQQSCGMNHNRTAVRRDNVRPSREDRWTPQQKKYQQQQDRRDEPIQPQAQNRQQHQSHLEQRKESTNNGRMQQSQRSRSSSVSSHRSHSQERHTMTDNRRFQQQRLQQQQLRPSHAQNMNSNGNGDIKYNNQGSHCSQDTRRKESLSSDANRNNQDRNRLHNIRTPLKKRWVPPSSSQPLTYAISESATVLTKPKNNQDGKVATVAQASSAVASVESETHAYSTTTTTTLGKKKSECEKQKLQKDHKEMVKATTTRKEVGKSGSHVQQQQHAKVLGSGAAVSVQGSCQKEQLRRFPFSDDVADSSTKRREPSSGNQEMSLTKSKKERETSTDASSSYQNEVAAIAVGQQVDHKPPAKIVDVAATPDLTVASTISRDNVFLEGGARPNDVSIPQLVGPTDEMSVLVVSESPYSLVNEEVDEMRQPIRRDVMVSERNNCKNNASAGKAVSSQAPTPPPATGKDYQMISAAAAQERAVSISSGKMEETPTQNLSPNSKWEIDCGSCSSSDDTDDDSCSSKENEQEILRWAQKMFGVTPPGLRAPNDEGLNAGNAGSVSVSGLNLYAQTDTTNTSSASGDRSVSSLSDQEEPILVVVQKKSKKQKRHNKLKTDKPGNLEMGSRSTSKKFATPKMSAMEKAVRKEEREKQQQLDEIEAKRIKKEAKLLTAAEIKAILGEDEFVAPPSSWVRRSVRQPCRSAITAPNVRSLVGKLRDNDSDMVVLKLKKYISNPDTPQVVIDAVLDALEENSNCQALYIQNFNLGMKDEQILHLLKVL